MKRFLSLLLALSLVFTLALPAAAQEETEAPVSEETAVSTEVPEETTLPTEAPEETTAPTELPAESSVPAETATEPSETQVPETTEETLPVSADTVITHWSFLDPDEVLTEGTMTLYGVSAENPVDLDTVISMLPRAILAEGLEVTLTWQCPEFVPGKSGKFRFTASLQEGYVLSAEAPAVSCLVVVPAADTEDQPQKEGDSADSEVQLAEGDIALDAANFPDANFLAAVQEQFDVNGDTVLSSAERSVTAPLDVSYREIKDLTGIKFLPNLTDLTCDGNPLTKLDLSGLLSLRNLYCSNTSLTAVNVKGCNNLQSLIALSAPIASLQLEGCSALRKIYLSSCALKTFTLRNHASLNDLSIGSADSLTAVDLTGCKALQSLSVFQCNLNSLNLQGCTALETLFCGSNRLDSLDLHTNKKLSLVDCGGNRLACLDLSGCPGLTKDNAFSYQNIILVGSKTVPLADISPNLQAKNLKVISGGSLSRNTLHLTADVLTYEYNCGTAANYIPMEVTLIYQQPGGTLFPIDGNNFPDPVLRQYVKDHFDQNADGSLSRAERSAVLSISLGSKTITSMKGLYHFRNLNTLSLQGCKISALDLPKLPALYELNIDGTQITSLNLANTPYLGSLSIRNTPITSLDLSKVPELTSLFMTGSSLQNLNLHFVPKLFTLDCSYSKLASLDVSKNPRLYHLECRGLDLKALDLTHNPDLAFLYCQDNQLKQLNLSRNTKLEIIDISRNQLTSIDLSHAANLYSFTCQDNTFFYPTQDWSLDLKTLPGFDISKASDWHYGTVDARGILTPDHLDTPVSYRYNTGNPSFNSAVFYISLQDKGVPINEVNFPDPAFCCYVKKQIDLDHSGSLDRQERLNVTSIVISSDTDLGYRKCTSLKGIEFFTSLQFLTCQYQDLKELKLSEPVSLTNVNVGSNPLRSLDVSGLPNLQALCCSGTRITSLGLWNNHNLQTLDCSNTLLNKLRFGNNTKLSSLDCRHTTLTALDTSNLPGLKQLNCSYSDITSLDLSQNPLLETLECTSSELTFLDLSHCPNITELNLGACHLTSLDLSANPALKHAWMNGNSRTFMTDAGKLPVSELPGFDPSKARSFKGGKIVDGYLVADPGSDIISYQYKISNSRSQYFKVKFRPESKLFTIAAANMTLGNDLTMHFYLNNADLDPNEYYYARVTRSFADGRPDEVRRIYQSDWGPFGKNMVRFSFTGLAAKEMTDSLEIQIFNQDDSPASKIKLDSIQDYCMRNLPKYTGPLRTLMVDMLNYGAAAQQHFGYGTSNLANAKLTAQQQSYATKTVSMQNNRQTDSYYVGSTLKLENRLMMDIYFKDLKPGMKVLYIYADHTGHCHTDSVKYEYLKVNGPYRVLTVEGIVIADCREMIGIRVIGSDRHDLANIEESPESYCARMQQKGAIYEAIMKFSTSAYNYLHNR